MLENPVINTEYKDKYEKSTRDIMPQKFLGGPILVVKGFKTEKDRIKVLKILFFINETLIL